MKAILHKSDTRGYADHGWLKSFHSFSFAGFHDPDKMGFGLLRVLNDDVVSGGMGFATHPHNNMEIISIPLSGSLRHKDNMGNTSIIKTDEVQVMSAGTGVQHSEFNNSRTDPVNFLQLWIHPKVANIEPSYHQKLFPQADQLNNWQVLVSPDGQGLRINQDAYISKGYFEEHKTIKYQIKKEANGIYIFLLSGSIKIDSYLMTSKDALGVWDTNEVSISAMDDSHILMVEVPISQ